MSTDIANQEPEQEAPAAAAWDFLRILRNAAYLVAAQGATRVAGFAYVLLLARFLSASQFGLLNLTLSVLLIVDMMADLGLSRLAIRDLSRDGTDTDAVVARLLVLKLILSGGAYVGLVAAAWIVGGSPIAIGILGIAGWSLLPSGLASILESVLHARQRFAVVSMARGGLSLAQAGLGALVLIAGGDIFGVAGTFVLAYVGFFAALIFALTRSGLRLRLVLDKTFMGTWLLAALPFSVVGVVFVLNVRIDLLVFGWFDDPARVAIYGMAIKVVEATLLGTIALGTALTPSFSRFYAQSREALVALYLRSLGFVLILTIPAALVASVAAPLVLRRLLPAAYDPVGPLVHVMFAGFPLWVAYYLNASLLLGTDRQYHSTAVLVALVIGQFAISLALVPRFGAAGAATAFALSGLLSWIGTAIYVARLLDISAALARTLARPIAGGVLAVAPVLAGGDRLLPAGLALFAAVMLTDPSWRAVVLRRRPSRA